MSSNPQPAGSPLETKEEDERLRLFTRAVLKAFEAARVWQHQSLHPSLRHVSDYSQIFEAAERNLEGALASALPATTPVGREEFLRVVSAGLGHRSWILDELASAPFMLEVDFSELQMGGFVAEPQAAHEVRFDVTRFLEREVDPSRLVFLALYPSGAIRSLSTTVERNGGTWVSLNDPSALLDPDVGSLVTRCQVKLVALETPAL